MVKYKSLLVLSQQVVDDLGGSGIEYILQNEIPLQVPKEHKQGRGTKIKLDNIGICRSALYSQTLYVEINVPEPIDTKLYLHLLYYKEDQVNSNNKIAYVLTPDPNHSRIEEII